jgi:hypothetical protein
LNESAVLDKLELRIPAPTPFRKEFGELYAELRNPAGETRPLFRPSKHYLAVGDLRAHGIEAVLHLHCKHGSLANHKVELLDTGKRGYREAIDEVTRIFDHPAPTSLEVMRVDCAADILGASVPWFEERARVACKRWHARLGETEFSEMGTRELQTLYFGKRPNCIRIYNKTAEYQKQYRDLCSGIHSPEDRCRCGYLRRDHHSGQLNCLEFRLVARGALPDHIPTFEELFGISKVTVLTRVERQIGGGRVPPEFSTVGLIARNAARVNPFARLQLIGNGRPCPEPGDYDFQFYCTGMHLRHLAETRGAHWLKAFVDGDGHRNGSRRLETYRDFLPSDLDNDAAVTVEQIADTYQQSAGRQLAA